MPDLAAGKDWYRKVLGVDPYFDQPFYAGFNVAGYELGLIPDTLPPGRPEAGLAYWGVPDADRAYARLLELGATPHEPISDVGEGIRIGSVRDPFGNFFGVIFNPQFKLPSQAP